MIELTDEQVFAIYEMEHWWNTQTKQVFEISGAAGTGKTTLVKYLIEKIGLKLDNVLFVAFMGKAVAQLARHGLPAKTIHSAIYNYVKIPARDENGKIILKKNGYPKMVGKFELKEKIGNSKKIKLIVVDEAAMVNVQLANDLLSFNIPTIVLGDMNQLPPVFGDTPFLYHPDVILKQIMRQKEGNPIIWLSQQILLGHELEIGVYKNSAVIPKKNVNQFMYANANVILTGTNSLRHHVNCFCREKIKKISRLDYPHIGEKVICKKNNWRQKITSKGAEYYLTNGLTGFVDYVEKSSFDGKRMVIDFRPDFLHTPFKNIKLDYKHLYEDPDEDNDNGFDPYIDKFEYAYAITVHSSQGSQWGNVLYLAENFMRNREDAKRFNYTAITRAVDSITIVKDD